MVRIQVGRARIACTEAGSGQPVVLLHGSATSAAFSHGLIQALATRFHVQAPDLHGRGKSGAWPGPSPLTLADEAAIVAALADRAGEPVHLLGHAYGAAVALHFAVAHPGRLRSLVLVEPAGFPLLREAKAAGSRHGAGAWAHMSEGRHPANEDRPAAAIGAPALLVCGTGSPAPMWSVATVLADVLPQARMLRVPEVGQMRPATCPGAVASAILAHFCAAATASLRLRHLGASDLPLVEQHLLALDPMDRHARFGAGCGDARISGYVRGIDATRAILMGAVDGATGRIVGLAEAQPAMKGPHWVELAVSVHRSHRRYGLGRRLVTAVMQAAFARGIEGAECYFEPANGPAVSLARALGAHVDPGNARGEFRRTVLLPQPRVA